MLRTRIAAAAVLVAGLAAFAQTPPAAPPATPPAKAPATPPATPPAAPPAATPTPPPAAKPAAPAAPPAAAPTPPQPAAKPATPPAAPTPPIAPAPNAQFQLKFEKNKAFYQKISSIVTQTFKSQGGADSMQKHEQTFYFKWLPVEQVGDKWTVKMTIEGAKMSVDIAGNLVKYDTTVPPDAASAGGLAEFFTKLVGSEFTVTFGKNMAVEKVDGREAFLAKIGGVNNNMEKILNTMLTQESLKQMVDPSFGLSPKTDQPVGGTWEKTTDMSLGPIGSYVLTTKYTYKGKDPTQKELDRIELNSTLKYNPPTDQQDGLLFKIKGGTLASLDLTPDHAAKNFVLYDPKLGRIVSSSMTVKVKGTLNVSIGGSDTTIELNQEQTTTVNTDDKSFLPAPPAPPTTTAVPPAAAPPAEAPKK